MQSSSLVHPGHHLVVCAVEAVHPDHTGLGLHVSVVRVGGVEIVFKYSQPIQMLNLKTTQIRGRGKHKKRFIFFSISCVSSLVVKLTCTNTHTK